MGYRSIQFDLSEKGINQAIRELEQYKKEFMRKCNELIDEMTQQGVHVAKLFTASLVAFDTGYLQDNIEGFFDAESRVGFIRANCWYAVYVEYGTGIVGASKSHPNAAAHGWVYDVNSHGEKGWVYFSAHDGQCQFHHTKGQPSKPFMYSTYRDLQRQAKTIAASIFC